MSNAPRTPRRRSSLLLCATFAISVTATSPSNADAAPELTLKGRADLKAATFARSYDIEISVVRTAGDNNTATLKVTHKGNTCTFIADRKNDDLIIQPRQTCPITFNDNGTQVALTGEVTRGVFDKTPEGKDHLTLAFTAAGTVQNPPLKGPWNMEIKVPAIPVQGTGSFDGRAQ